jgi:hypothetical protein
MESSSREEKRSLREKSPPLPWATFPFRAHLGT